MLKIVPQQMSLLRKGIADLQVMYIATTQNVLILSVYFYHVK
jgi:hypothetical protein